MFNLVVLKDTVIINPWNFNKQRFTVILDTLNNRFSNKVIHNVGLCLSVWDLLKVEDSCILPGDGATHTNVTFRAIVYRPFIDEVIVGKIKSCTKERIQVTVGCFDDIFILPEYLQENSSFDSKEETWKWQYEDGGEAHDLFMDIGQQIRFRVIGEKFTDLSPSGPRNENAEEMVEPNLTKSYEITGSICEPGLGLISWWES
ncbi:DgyrCDS7783 [Dimorphilus gyrociliatus]|uniref:DgyrCDS7783 n=1 Tax=Dimorphilus gyrociliatus TaxID=2664684 RepID=A0A7I8VX19_9ANNE|nr:DgyrCDS7783 [Dimorphilus gyrociliatus]